jgi:transcriptional regulator with XRE-family HTH domain
VLSCKPKTIYPPLPAALSGRSHAARITSRQLAAAIGATTGTITQWKTGETKKYDAELVVKAAQFLDVDVEWLVLGEGSPERIRKTSLRMAEIVDNLPREPRQQTLDFISYQLTKAEPLMAGEKSAHYHKMIDTIISDMQRRNQ